MKKRIAILISVTILAVLGCAACQNPDAGMVAGGVVGGVAGNALTRGSAAGTIIGAVGGGYIGRQMSE